MSAAKLHLRPALLGCLGLLLAAPAHAQTPMPTPGATALTKDDFDLKLLKADEKTFLTTDVDRALYLNRANCQCKSGFFLRVGLTATGVSKATNLPTLQTAEVRIGGPECVASDVTSVEMAKTKCTSLGTVVLADLARRAKDFPATVFDLFAAKNLNAPAGDECGIEAPQTIWLAVDTTGDQRPDLTDAPSLALNIDGKAPPPPSDVVVTPGNEALSVSWTRTTVVSDQNGYVVFCSRAGLPVFKDTFFHGKDFFTQQLVCGTSTTGITQKLTAADPVLAADNLEADTGRPIDAPAEMQRLDTAYVCSNLLTTSSEWRIHTLQNGIQYVVGVASVDTHGNASPLDLALVQTPIPTTDFYRAYRAAGGGADGGFCSYGQRPRAAGWWLSLLAVAALAVSRRRR
jgi:hypothetical protein